MAKTKETIKKTETTKDTQITKVVEKVKDELMNQPLQQFSNLDKKEYQTIIKGIVSEISKVEKSYLAIAFKLFQIYDKKLYTIDNFQTIYDFAKDTFSLSRGTCNNYINIVQQFGEYTVDEKNFITYTGKLNPAFEKFSSSKLIVMLGLPNHILDTLSPDMTVVQIKDIKREYNDMNSAIEETENDSESKDIVDTTSKDVTDDDSDDDSENDDFELTSDEKKAKSIRIALVDDLLNLSDDICEMVSDAFEDFTAKYPDKKPSFDIRLVW